MSSQEDITLVNLQMQVNKPILDSPLLMASYVSHLAQVRCANWSTCCLPLGADAFSTPLFQQNDDGGLSYIGKIHLFHLIKKKTHLFASNRARVMKSGIFVIFLVGCKLVPHFNTYSNWREVRIVSQAEAGTSASMHNASNIAQSVPRSHPWDPNVVIRSADSGNHAESKSHNQ